MRALISIVTIFHQVDSLCNSQVFLGPKTLQPLTITLPITFSIIYFLYNQPLNMPIK